MSTEVYLTFDFEAVNRNGLWWACGIVLAEYPTRKVLDHRLFIVDRRVRDFDKHTMSFWSKNVAAFMFLRNHSTAVSEQKAEIELIDYLNSVWKKYVRVKIISDNPQFDVRLMDNILIKNGQPVLALRVPNKYLYVTCTRSFRQGCTKNNIIIQGKTLHIINHVLQHVPVNDSCHILSRHFDILDSIQKSKSLSSSLSKC